MTNLPRILAVAALFSVSVIAGSGVARAALGDAPASVAAPDDALQKMQKLMIAIRATKDPTEHARLMGEHLKAMQITFATIQREKGCMTMRQEKGCMMMDLLVKGGGVANNAESASGNDMMWMMIGQMRQHENAIRGAGE